MTERHSDCRCVLCSGRWDNLPTEEKIRIHAIVVRVAGADAAKVFDPNASVAQR